MAFVSELISEADKARIDWNRFKWDEHSPPHYPWKWSIDRERDAFLIPVELPGRDETHSRPDVFDLSWHGHVIRLAGHATGWGRGKYWEKMRWRIVELAIPASLEACEAEVRQLIKDALDAYGSYFDTQHLEDVEVEFDAGSAS